MVEVHYHPLNPTASGVCLTARNAAVHLSEALVPLLGEQSLGLVDGLAGLVDSSADTGHRNLRADPSEAAAFRGYSFLPTALPGTDRRPSDRLSGGLQVLPAAAAAACKTPHKGTS